MKASIEAWEASKLKKDCEEEKAKSKELSDSTFFSTSSNLQENKEMPYEIPKVVSCDVSNTSFVLQNFQQPYLPRFDVPFHYDIDFSFLHSKFSGRNLDCDIRFSPLHIDLIAYPWLCDFEFVIMIDCRGLDCTLEFSVYLIICKIYNVRRALSVYMLCIIWKGTRMKTCLALSDFVFPVGFVVQSGWYLSRLRRMRKFPAKRKSKLFPFVVVVDLGTNRIKEGGDDVSTSRTSFSHFIISGKYLLLNLLHNDV
ncbi:hypothetical protein GQ457_18G009680 [Hibiscus cannabinus]